MGPDVAIAMNPSATHPRRPRSARAALSVALILTTLWAPPTPRAADAESGARPARISGVVPVLRKKAPSAVKDYGPPPAFKVDKPEPPKSAVWVGSGAPPTQPARSRVAAGISRGDAEVSVEDAKSPILAVQRPFKASDGALVMIATLGPMRAAERGCCSPGPGRRRWRSGWAWPRRP